MGSTLVIVAATREDVVGQLKADIYTEKGVWDVENVRPPTSFLPACLPACQLALTTTLCSSRRRSGLSRSLSETPDGDRHQGGSGISYTTRS